MSKVCRRCSLEKDVTLFSKDSKSNDGLMARCKDCCSILYKEYRVRNKERLSTNFKLYYEENKEVLLNKKKVYNDNNKEKISDYGKKYRSENKEVITKKKIKYKKERSLVDPLYKLKETLRTRIRQLLKSEGRSETLLNVVGTSYEIVKNHIENQFKEGMNWDNHGLYGWHIDHKIPLSSAKTEEELIKLCHYTNLQPLWAEENLRKSNTLITK